MDKRLIAVLIIVGALAVLIPVLPKITHKSGGDPQQDAQNQQRIQQAISVYSGKNGSFPPTLDSLVPEYLAAVPQPSRGGYFQYEPTTGSVTNPFPATGAPAGAPMQSGRRGAPPVGGTGAMGEAMTGIGISQELK